MQNNRLRILLFVVLAIIFLAGVLQLFSIRFEKGDVYPAYSSFRADPLGTKALYSSLQNLEGISVNQNHHALQKLQPDHDTTLMYLGAPPYRSFLDAADARHLNRFVWVGGRVVISFVHSKRPFYPPDKNSASNQAEKADQCDCPKTKKPSEKMDTDPEEQKQDADAEEHKPVLLPDLWGFSFQEMDQQKQAQQVALPSGRWAASPNARPITWHSGIAFDLPDDRWEVLYAVGEQPVIIERKLGRGSIFIAADSFFLSNEALRRERQTDLLVKMVGSSRNVLFDESHFGIRSQSGFAGLFWKYRLQGLLISGVAFMLLFVWKNAFSFMPMPGEPPDDDMPRYLSTRDYTSGLTSLLRKNIKPKAILAACGSEWQKSFSSTRQKDPEHVAKIQKIKQIIGEENTGATRQTDPVAGYNAIYKILSEKKTI